MPYPSEHAARVREPGRFQQDTFRRVNIAPGIDAIMGKLKGENSMTIQTYRFDKTKFTVAQAKAWLKNHNVTPLSFEPATDERMNTAIRRAAGRS